MATTSGGTCRSRERDEHERTPPPGAPGATVRTLPCVGGLAQEVRAIDETISRLEAEIAENEASMTPEEVQRVRADHEADMTLLGGLTFEERIAALELVIAELEAREEETNERRG